MWEERLKILDAIVDKCPRFERKGKTMPYTSANGYMFALLNKDAEIGFRLPKDRQAEFKEKHNTTIYKSYNAVMKDYVLIPDDLINDLDYLAEILNESYDFVMTLKPK